MNLPFILEVFHNFLEIVALSSHLSMQTYFRRRTIASFHYHRQQINLTTDGRFLFTKENGILFKVTFDRDDRSGSKRPRGETRAHKRMFVHLHTIARNARDVPMNALGLDLHNRVATT